MPSSVIVGGARTPTGKLRRVEGPHGPGHQNRGYPAVLDVWVWTGVSSLGLAGGADAVAVRAARELVDPELGHGRRGG